MWGKMSQGMTMWNSQNGNQQMQYNPWSGNQQTQWGNQQQQQQWNSPYQQYFVIKGRQSGKAIDISKQNNQNKGCTIIWDIHGNDNQLFALEPNGHGQCQIKSKEGGYLTVQNSSQNNEARIISAQNHFGAAQYFQLVPVQGQQNCYYIKTFCGKCLDVLGQKSNNGAKIAQWKYNGGRNQQFYIEPVRKAIKNHKGDTTSQQFALKSKSSGKALDVSQAPKTKDHTIIWDYHGNSNQKFKFQLNPMGLYSIKCSDGRYLTILKNDSSDGAKCKAEKWSGQPGQLFQLVSSGQKNCYFIKTFCGKVLDIYGNKTENQSEIVQWSHNGGANQQWYLIN